MTRAFQINLGLLYFFSSEFKEYIDFIDLWVLDGTFRSVPRDFYQLLTFKGFIFGKYIPFIFALMLNKEENSYQKISVICLKNIILN
jgi:hypothetical protein